jgi:hypothetical protein
MNGTIFGKGLENDRKCKLLVMLSTRYSCPTLMKLEFSRQNLKNTQTSNNMKIHPVGAESFHADSRTDMTKLIVVFHNFANAPKAKAEIRL